MMTGWFPAGVAPAHDGCYIVRRPKTECWFFCRWCGVTGQWFSAGSTGTSQSDVIGWSSNAQTYEWRGLENLELFGKSNVKFSGLTEMIEKTGAAPQPAHPSEPAQPVALPLTVDVCFIDGDDPFICTVHGKITVDALSEIEADIHENPDFGKGDGVYSYNVTRFNGQYGFEGRCELPPGWELDEIGYEPIEAAHGIGGGR